MTTEDFVARAKEKFGDKYDYSKVKYINIDSNVTIICPLHGEFQQTPYCHLKGNGCQECHKIVLLERQREKNEQLFLQKAKEKFGDKYDYSKMDYVNNSTDVIIICPLHGEFRQKPAVHIRQNSVGCPVCGNELKISKNKDNAKTSEEFIERAHEIHGDKYDYSEVDYVNAKTKVRIICHEKDEFGKEHGVFFQLPYSHLKGSGCPKCKGKTKYTTETFIEKAHMVHGDRYDYSKVKYINNNSKVCITCPEHGEFLTTPYVHLNGAQCPYCAHPSRKKTTKEFITDAKKVHGDKYDYSKVEYINKDTDICIICPEHGEFWQLPSHHLKGSGCPNCSGLRKEYKFNLLKEFIDEYHLREFLMTNDENMIYIILRNIEKINPKYNPIVKDIDRALHSNSDAPIKDLEDKYRKTDVEITNEVATNMHSSTSIQALDLDDDDAVDAYINNTTEGEKKNEAKEPTIEDLTKARENEIKIINKIEHMLTPEDRQFIKDKFLNDRRRAWISQREKIGK